MALLASRFTVVLRALPLRLSFANLILRVQPRLFPSFDTDTSSNPPWLVVRTKRLLRLVWQTLSLTVNVTSLGAMIHGLLDINGREHLRSQAPAYFICGLILCAASQYSSLARIPCEIEEIRRCVHQWHNEYRRIYRGLCLVWEAWMNPVSHWT